MGQPTTVRGLLEVASTWLKEQGVDEARLNTEHLLAHVLGCRRLDLYLDIDRPLDDAERDRFRGLMRRRGARIPLAYLLGTKGFMGHDFKVAPGVLIPRQETEQRQGVPHPAQPSASANAMPRRSSMPSASTNPTASITTSGTRPRRWLPVSPTTRVNRPGPTQVVALPVSANRP